MIDATRIYDLKDRKSAAEYTITRKSDTEFEVTGERIEQIVRMTNMNNFEAVMRVYDVLDKLRVTQKIENKLVLEYGKEITESYFE